MRSAVSRFVLTHWMYRDSNDTDKHMEKLTKTAISTAHMLELQCVSPSLVQYELDLVTPNAKHGGELRWNAPKA